MFPALTGWHFGVENVEDEPDETGGVFMGHKHVVLQQMECKHVDGDEALMHRTFIGISPWPLWGRTFHTTDQSAFTTRTGNSFVCNLVEQQNGQTEQCAIRLRPIFTDNVTCWLPIGQSQKLRGIVSESKFRFPTGDQTYERAAVQESFRNWLLPLQSGTNAGPNMPMHMLHRVYWAIRSNRPKLAQVLMHRAEDPILAGLFSAYLYNRQKLPHGFVPDAEQSAKYLPLAMTIASEQYACEILDNAIFAGSTAAFDEFVFYGKSASVFCGPRVQRELGRLTDRGFAGTEEEDTVDFNRFFFKDTRRFKNSNLRR